jgi:hypothetical protein
MLHSTVSVRAELFLNENQDKCFGKPVHKKSYHNYDTDGAESR